MQKHESNRTVAIKVDRNGVGSFSSGACSIEFEVFDFRLSLISTFSLCSQAKGD